MNSHKNARLTYARRMELVEDITERGRSPCRAAQAHGVTAPTARIAGALGISASAAQFPRNTVAQSAWNSSAASGA